LSKSQVRVGVIGTSGWTEFAYLDNLRDFEHGEVVAISGRNVERLAEVAAKYGIEKTFADWQEMIWSGEIDAVIVASPDEVHHEMVLNAARAGLHVICEKPLAANAQQALEMLEAVTDAGVVNNVLFTYLHSPAFKYLRDLLDDGLVGRVYHSEFHYLMGYARDSQYHWRLDAERGTGALGDLGVHMFALAQWLVAPISSVSASLHNSVDRLDSDGNVVAPTNDSANLVVEYADGSHGTIFATLVADLGDRFMEQRIKIFGENGSAEFTLVYEGANKGPHLWISREGGESGPVQIPESYLAGLAADDMWGHLRTTDTGVRQFVKNVAQGTQDGPNFYDGLLAQLVIDAAFESARQGKRILIEP
jgi:predicted dehydrogenase